MTIVMNQLRPNIDTYTDATQLVIGSKRSSKIRRPSQRLIWEPKPNQQLIKRTTDEKEWYMQIVERTECTSLISF